MLHISIDYTRFNTAPAATLRLSLEEIDAVSLSVAFRAARNRTALYQQKHISQAAGLETRERDPALAALNRPIAEHYQLLRSSFKDLDNRRVLALPISDLTANPLRPHFDASAHPEGAFRSEAARAGVFRSGSDGRLFFLEDEPIGEVPYTLLLCYEQEGRTRLHIQHGVQVRPDGSLPGDLPEEIRAGLRYWIACPPLLVSREHRLDMYCTLDYDPRHVFGFEHNYAKFGCASGAEHAAALYGMYAAFPRWESWCAAVRDRLAALPVYETGYNAALGLSDKELIVIHRVSTIPELAQELRELGAVNAVLLDSGGSCAIWANWVNGNRGGVLANAWNFREARGAVFFLILRGERGLRLRNP